VTRLDDGYSYRATPGNAARETDYYRVESEDLDPIEVPPLVFETMLGTAEGYGKRGKHSATTNNPSPLRGRPGTE